MISAAIFLFGLSGGFLAFDMTPLSVTLFGCGICLLVIDLREEIEKQTNELNSTLNNKE